MSEQVVAYALSPFWDGDTDGGFAGGRPHGGGRPLGGERTSAFASGGERPRALASGGDSTVTVFTSSEQCRAALRDTPSTAPAIVCNGAGTVTPINLAAALCMDSPERDVYLMEDAPTGSLASRARSAGIRGILDCTQATRQFNVPGLLPAPAAAPAPIPASAPIPVPAPIPASDPTAPIAARGRIIGVFSGRGGVGKSTVALMLALTAQKHGLRTALVDLDLQFGDMGYLAGKEPQGRIARLPLAQLCASDTIPDLYDDELALVLAPELPEQGEQFAPDIPSVLERLAAKRDVVVLNTGSFWTEVHARAVRQCDHLVLLMDQRATSVEACRQVVDLCLRLQAPQARFHYLLNGCGRHAALMPQDVGLALGGVEVFGLADGGSLVDELLALGCPIELLSSGNAFVASLEAFFDGLMGNCQPSSDASSAKEGSRRSGRGARIFDISALRLLFEGRNRVAT
jgi:pilus assembly protein CpaE